MTTITNPEARFYEDQFDHWDDDTTRELMRKMKDASDREFTNLRKAVMKHRELLELVLGVPKDQA